MRSNARASEWVVAARRCRSVSVSFSSREERSAQRAWASRSSQPWQGCARIARRSVANFNSAKQPNIPLLPPRDPLYDIAELDGIVTSDTRKQYDVQLGHTQLNDATVAMIPPERKKYLQWYANK